MSGEIILDFGGIRVERASGSKPSYGALEDAVSPDSAVVVRFFRGELERACTVPECDFFETLVNCVLQTIRQPDQEIRSTLWEYEEALVFRRLGTSLHVKVEPGTSRGELDVLSCLEQSLAALGCAVARAAEEGRLKVDPKRGLDGRYLIPVRASKSDTRDDGGDAGRSSLIRLVVEDAPPNEEGG